MNPAWFKLIAHQQRRHKLALTIPFLMGAAQDPIGIGFNSEEHALAALAASIRQVESEAPTTHFVSILNCPTLGEPVASTTSTRYLASHSLWGVGDLAKKSRLRIAAPYSMHEHPDHDYLIQQLWRQLRAPLTNGHFSFFGRSYQKFSAED